MNTKKLSIQTGKMCTIHPTTGEYSKLSELAKQYGVSRASLATSLFRDALEDAWAARQFNRSANASLLEVAPPKVGDKVTLDNVKHDHRRLSFKARGTKVIYRKAAKLTPNEHLETPWEYWTARGWERLTCKTTALELTKMIRRGLCTYSQVGA